MNATFTILNINTHRCYTSMKKLLVWYYVYGIKLIHWNNYWWTQSVGRYVGSRCHKMIIFCTRKPCIDIIVSMALAFKLKCLIQVYFVDILGAIQKTLLEVEAFFIRFAPFPRIGKIWVPPSAYIFYKTLSLCSMASFKPFHFWAKFGNPPEDCKSWVNDKIWVAHLKTATPQ